MAMHCEPCLQANHRGCKIMLPAEWEDDLGRCVCKCAGKVEPAAVKAGRQPRPPSRKRGPQGPSKWTEDRIRELCRLEKEGHTSRQIGVLVGADATTVRTYLGKARKAGWR